jgi:hypothetical protein
MTRFVLNSVRLLAVLFLLHFSIPMFAQAPGNIKVHFTDEVAVPGHLVPPGDYEFHRLDDSDPYTYELISDNGQDLIGIFHVITTERANYGEPGVELSAPDASGIRMIQAWYDPGREGFEFIYSKKDMRNLQFAETQSHATGSVGQP